MLCLQPATRQRPRMKDPPLAKQLTTPLPEGTRKAMMTCPRTSQKSLIPTLRSQETRWGNRNRRRQTRRRTRSYSRQMVLTSQKRCLSQERSKAVIQLLMLTTARTMPAVKS